MVGFLSRWKLEESLCCRDKPKISEENYEGNFCVWCVRVSKTNLSIEGINKSQKLRRIFDVSSYFL